MVINAGPVPQSHLASYFAASQALLLPTLLESFSGSYVEAMHFGVPILTSDMDFAREVCGEAALYFDPHVPKSICQAICTLRDNVEKREELAAKGAQRVVGIPYRLEPHRWTGNAGIDTNQSKRDMRNWISLARPIRSLPRGAFQCVC